MSYGEAQASSVQEHLVSRRDATVASRPDVGVRDHMNGVLKRVLDLLGAVLLLVLLSPLFLFLAVAIRIDSSGPSWFRQTRVGRHGRHFTVYKLRTMRQANDDREHAEYVAALFRGCAPAHDGLYKLVDDPRSTRFGRFLRVSSLDELPQLVNVLKGEMSLVGPRPSTPDESASWNRRARGRLAVKPGMTGPWQVSGRSRLTFDEMIALDLDYAANWTPWLDLTILARTPRAALRRETA